MAYGDLSAAEKGFKRALLMVERSYKIDTHLRSTLLANLSNVHRISGNKDSCLHYIEQLLPLLSPNYKVQKQASVDISTLNPAESQEALDQFWKELTQPGYSTTGETKDPIANSGTFSERFYNCKQLFTSVRKIQFILSTGHCIGTMRLHEEGLIYMNMAFETILSNSLIEHAGCGLQVGDSFILSAALMRLADLSNHSQVTRRDGRRAIVRTSCAYECSGCHRGQTGDEESLGRCGSISARSLPRGRGGKRRRGYCPSRAAVPTQSREFQLGGSYCSYRSTSR